MKKRDTTPDETASKDLVVKTEWAGVPDVEHTKECYRCQLVMRGPSETRARHCPRCGYDSDTIIIDSGGIPEEERKSWIAAVDLGKIYSNWAIGYCRIMDRTQVADYSCIDDFMVDVLEQSFPYLKRLTDENILLDDGLSYVRACVNEAALSIVTKCQEWEELQRLTGTWSDQDGEHKEYWLKRYRGLHQIVSTSTTKRIELKDSGEDGEKGC